MILFLRTAYSPSPAQAADIRTNDTIIISENEKNLSDLYLFGSTIQVSAPVANDLVAAGNSVSINNNTSGSLLTAGSSLDIRGDIGGSIRAAGGNIVIDGNIARDLVLAGGSINIAKTAVINGDLIVAGGQINLQGNVNGKAVISGGQVNIEGKINKQLDGQIDRLTLGPNAVIGGNLSYSSPQKAVISRGAQIQGDEQFKKTEKRRGSDTDFTGFITAFTFYKLLADIIISLLAIYFFGGYLYRLYTQISLKEPFKNSIFGLAFIIITPIIALLFLALLWLSAAVFLFYLLLIILSALIAKIFLGWLIVRWWYRRDKKTYALDWKSAVVGPIAALLIGLIPVLGWLILAILYLITSGALIQSFLNTARTQRLQAKKK